MTIETQVPIVNCQGVVFTVYNAEEIKNLSVLEITNIHTFDALGHPNPGGLYDPRLGPTDRDEMCRTCGQRSLLCPGHMGHITLPLIVFNSLFIRDAFQLINATCFSCRQFRAPKLACLLVTSQLKALSYGLLMTAKELESAYHEITGDGETNSTSSLLLIQSRFDEILNSALTDLDLTKAKEDAQVKNIVDYRRTILKKFMQDHISKAPRKCSVCGTQKLMMLLEYNSRIVIRKFGRKLQTKTEKLAEKNNAADFEMEENAGGNANDDNDEFQDMKQTYLTPKQAKEHLLKVYENEKALISQLFQPLITSVKDCVVSPIEGFFIEVLPVSPSRFRPLSFMHGQKFENPFSVVLNKLLQDCLVIRSLLLALKSGNERFNESVASIIAKLPGVTVAEKLQSSWYNLQRKVNMVFDSDLDRLQTDKLPGVKQILEKKEGLFRMHMMGKRVNYAARSVISPDPYIRVDEIGIPAVFATKLTYPEVVNKFTAEELRKAILNGPDVHPGATMVKNEDGHVTVLSSDEVQRKRIANKLFNENYMAENKIVYRHLKDGDILLLNRQPTLHKPSMMAHKARVLKSEKTLRLNYSACKTYNADFDGDEMNAHFPQSEAARSEAYAIANVGNQYLVPKDGTPLGGLIQDHIIGAAKLMTRGRFFSREDYQQLVYGAIYTKKKKITLLRPAIVKPCPLWSGKQVVSTVVINTIPQGKHLLNLTGSSKISDKCWQRYPPRKWKAGGTPLKGNSMSENEVIVRNGELLCGIFDKSHCGPTPYGLIHCCFELYGGEIAALLLSELEILFTNFLQYSGFSLGVEDILVTKNADKKRRKIMETSKDLGYDVIRTALKLSQNTDDESVRSSLLDAHLSRDDKLMKDVDNTVKSKTDAINNEINKVCMPQGLLKPFPHNSLQLMVLSGAKGSMVNCMQISCLLGQIELEGRRPPLMLSGRSLPSFLPYSTTTRAGGFVDGRFLTGIRPQEYFFHCMAGREGLIDTAVKTSRSGYLQRCLIKHLEGVTVAYDMTVRDSDGSILQFQYGEDGLDISKVPFLKAKQFPLLEENYKLVRDDEIISLLKADESQREITKYSKKVRKWAKKNDTKKKDKRSNGFLKYAESQNFNTKEELVESWRGLDKDERARYERRAGYHLDPVTSLYRSDRHLGAITEKLDAIIESYASDRLTSLSVDSFRDMLYYKIQTSHCDPGESVGLLAAQSIGEPSTQMTLNTFHFAGRGEMNVTLGIPRLREILMTASANISTPSLEVPFLGENDEVEKNGEYLKKRLTRVYLSDLIHNLSLHERSNFNATGKNRTYVIKFNFLPRKTYRKRFNVTPAKILRYMEKVFILKLLAAIKTHIRIMSKTTMLHNVVIRGSGDSTSSPAEKEEEDLTNENRETKDENKSLSENEESSDDEDAGDEADATANRNRMRHQQDREYEPLDEEEKDIANNSDVDYGDISDEEENPSKLNKSDTSFIEDDDDKPNRSKNHEANTSFIEEDSVSNFDINTKLSEDKPSSSSVDKSRIEEVLNKSEYLTNYNYDPKKEEWCEFTFKMSISIQRLNFNDILEEQVKKAIVYHVPGIKKAFTVDQNNVDGTCQRILKTEGISITEMFNYENMVDLKQLYANDIHAIAKTYGIEAAARVIVKEIQNVFMVYGIEVDPRHLLLVADYMTFDGFYKPFNRIGMENSVSPLQQMSFESTMKFLKMATLSGTPDMLKSPSARLVVGRPVSCGTGCFTLVHHIK